ncbi:MAG: MAPEG family protein [Novosphingobium sp.]
MPGTVNQLAIFVPMLVVVALTFVAFIRMAMARGAAVKAVPPSFYRAHQGGQEPEAAVVAVRHYGNLFELPTLFYAACITAFVLGAVSTWVLVFAWGYVACRLLQSAIHLTYNNPAHRGGAFVLSVVFVLALWVKLTLVICAGL